MSDVERRARASDADYRRGRHEKYTRQRGTRSQSPRRGGQPSRRHRYDDHGRTSERAGQSEPVALPFGTRPLSKHDLVRYRPVFGMYLDIQKGIELEELDERELKGRWKSFVGKWNRGELAEGWYDPDTLGKAQGYASSAGAIQSTSLGQAQQAFGSRSVSPRDEKRSDIAGGPHLRSDSRLPTAEYPEGAEPEEDVDDDEGYGPQLPSDPSSRRVDEKSGPTIPTIQDLQIQREEKRSSLEASRQVERASHKQARQSHKSEVRAVEDEVAPRAEAGTRERQLEKRREVAASNRAFAESRRGGSPGAAAPDAELMGGGDGKEDLEDLKREKKNEQRKKNEREIRKEEILRARAAEREEKLKSYRRKEEETMGFLRSLAKQRFG